ncbi:hypothetical protein [Pseudorhodobacter wandonensis]|uniref:hypothetical protein n=1 Tax=Pseudorhodobacter wandonensis TaxID=1120568 RepID=UPI0018CF3E5A|nr:hypothetical protein [Pseudorhodobacter wandonensis]
MKFGTKAHRIVYCRRSTFTSYQFGVDKDAPFSSWIAGRRFFGADQPESCFNRKCSGHDNHAG